MVFFHHISGLGVFLVATVALAAPATLKQPSEFQVGLNVAAKAAKKLYFGTATNADQWNDKTYFDILRDDREFGQITAANVMKWVCGCPRPSHPILTGITLALTTTLSLTQSLSRECSTSRTGTSSQTL